MKVDTNRMEEVQEQLNDIRRHIAQINAQTSSVHMHLADLGVGSEGEKQAILRSLKQQMEQTERWEELAGRLADALGEAREVYLKCEQDSKKATESGGSDASNPWRQASGYLHWEYIRRLLDQYIKPFIITRKRE